jgi:hypothetical protein
VVLLGTAGYYYPITGRERFDERTPPTRNDNNLSLDAGLNVQKILHINSRKY